jgi:hypothetical protein
VQPGVEARLGVAALIAGQGAAGRAGVPAGAGDSDGAGFAVVRREGQGGTVGLGSSHRWGDAGPALQPRRKARASHQRMAERSGAQRPARLAGETLAEARSMEGPAAPTPQRSRLFSGHGSANAVHHHCPALAGGIAVGAATDGLHHPALAEVQPAEPQPHAVGVESGAVD